MGSSLSRKLFPELVKCGEKYYDSIKDRMVEYTPYGFLYHITPVENISSIKRNGLVSEEGKVYLSGDVDYFRWFAYQKANELKRDVKFCILKIDAVSLSKAQKLYYRYYNVYYSGNIDPKYIVNL
ncbi:MAG: hypothetical protein IJS94_04030 [Clostridia bacterium]|nr:hypothetical protein [Clostridia bacterium]